MASIDRVPVACHDAVRLTVPAVTSGSSTRKGFVLIGSAPVVTVTSVAVHSPPVAIRRAQPADLDTLVDLHRAFCEADQHPFSEQRARAGFAGLLADDGPGVVWIVDHPAAYAVVTWGWSIEAGGLEAVLDEVFVTAPGEGVGGQLIDHVVADGARRGLARIFLETESHNERARQLYARHGFAVEDSIWMSVELTELS